MSNKLSEVVISALWYYLTHIKHTPFCHLGEESEIILLNRKTHSNALEEESWKGQI